MQWCRRRGSEHRSDRPDREQGARMTTIDRPAAPEVPAERPIDPDKLMAFVFRAVDEVGASLNTALVVLGDELGYYRALANGTPTSPAELAEATGTDEHYAREWLNAQAAG